jgi:hypothetical protein
MNVTEERKARGRVNTLLFELGREYHDGLPLRRIDAILQAHGFTGLDDGLYCGRDGRITEKVSERTWFILSWHKMCVTGRYEVIAYVS